MAGAKMQREDHAWPRLRHNLKHAIYCKLTDTIAKTPSKGVQRNWNRRKTQHQKADGCKLRERDVITKQRKKKATNERQIVAIRKARDCLKPAEKSDNFTLNVSNYIRVPNNCDSSASNLGYYFNVCELLHVLTLNHHVS